MSKETKSNRTDRTDRRDMLKDALEEFEENDKQLNKTLTSFDKRISNLEKQIKEKEN